MTDKIENLEQVMILLEKAAAKLEAAGLGNAMIKQQTDQALTGVNFMIENLEMEEEIEAELDL